jgi:hypothetical protein
LETTIKDFYGATIYKESSAGVHHTLAWMWKEILVAAASRGAPMKDIESDINRLKIKDEVYNFIRKDGGNSGALLYLCSI